MCVPVHDDHNGTQHARRMDIKHTTTWNNLDEIVSISTLQTANISLASYSALLNCYCSGNIDARWMEARVRENAK